MSPRSRRARLRYPLAATVWLTAMWVLLWGDLSLGTVVAGLAVAVVVGVVFRMPPVRVTGRLHVLPLLALVVLFLRDLVVASVQVVRLAFRFGRAPHSAVIGVLLRCPVDLYVTLTAELTSLVPGSVVVEAHRTTGMLYVHVLDVGIVHGLAAAREHVLENEARILRALASDEELAAAGLTRRAPRRRGAERQGVAR